MTLNIQQRLLGLIAAFVLLFLIGGAITHRGVDRLETANATSVMYTKAIREQMGADMMHDALRADVLAALHAGAKKSTQDLQAAASDVEQHGTQFTAALNQLERAELDAAIASNVTAVRPKLEAYVIDAKSIVRLAGEDVGRPEWRLPVGEALRQELHLRQEVRLGIPRDRHAAGQPRPGQCKPAQSEQSQNRQQRPAALIAVPV